MNSLNGGYAMIKYNSTQEELQIAYRSKKPVLCYDENRRAHWAVIEETATESVDEETQDPITIYEYSYRLIDEASGGKLYHHHILILETSIHYLTLNVISSSNVPYTYSTIHAYIREITNKATVGPQSYNCMARNASTYAYSCYASSDGKFYASSVNNDNSFNLSQDATVTDTVMEV